MTVGKGVSSPAPRRSMTGDAPVAWFRDRSLTLVLMGFFALFLAGQLWTGLAAYNETRREHGQGLVSVGRYLQTGHPWEALFENWESEFLQMAVFVLLTTVLVQRGSPESRRPGVKELVDIDPRDFADDPEAPWPVRRGGWVLRLYRVITRLGLYRAVRPVVGRSRPWRVPGVCGRQCGARWPAADIRALPAVGAILVRVVSELAERVPGHRRDGLAGGVPPTALFARIESRPRPACRDRAMTVLDGAFAVSWTTQLWPPTARGGTPRDRASPAAVSFSSSTRLKNSTVSSSVSSRPSCRYGGESLMPRSGKVLIGPSAAAIRPLIVIRLEEPLRLQVVHQVVGVVRRRVAGRALGLAEEERLAAQLRARWPSPDRACRTTLSFGAGGKSSSSWNSRHEVHLAAALERR